MPINLQNTDKQSTLHTASDKVGTYYLTDNPKYYEPQRSNNFVFYVSGLNTFLSIPQNTYAQANAEEVLKLSVSKSSVPHFTQAALAIKRGNNTMKFAGVPEFGQGSLNVIDYIGAGSKDILLAWQHKSYDPQTEKVGLASDYKKDAYLLEYTPDQQLVRTWKLCGCWVSGLSEDEYNNESNSIHNVSVTIEYDKAYIDTSSI